ncbi:hypothetical protein BDE36_2373 [Arcticibacter tournemirensis]|uniref:hypothetical protein n=1 Tax=Arcticibacter tournemirensis TaxID=699437 RepID=UPI0011510704|nr:hypothetical protein [Arcticibacter tournemirensis]TQM50626.1 hypothetical protein BDE36_2373 [Arcticibacter tournemirensis]
MGQNQIRGSVCPVRGQHLRNLQLDELTLEATIGRKPTDGEIERAKSIPFSVDYIFCTTCEDLFSQIENKFINDILPSFRRNNLSGIENITEPDPIAVRNFFYIQIYRSAVCEDILDFPDPFLEQMRVSILGKTGDKSIPLNVTYLQTAGETASYTENFVGFTSDKNPYIIFMNDFIIQVYEDSDKIHLNHFYGLNEEGNYKSYINHLEEGFTFRIFENAKRKNFLNNVVIGEKVQKNIQYYQEMFDLFWRKLFGVDAPAHQKQRYIENLIKGDRNNLIKYSKEEVLQFTKSYMKNLFKIKE